MSWFTWSPLELTANFFTVVCIILAGRNNIHTWWTGLVGAMLYGIMFYKVQLYADATLQIFFLVTGVLGWIGWNANKVLYQIDEQTPIITAKFSTIVKMICTAGAVAIGYGWLLHSFTNAYAPWIDSTVLAFSVVAQLLLMTRSVQTWHVWIFVNTLSVPLFWSRELYLTSVMYGFFWCNAVYSYFHWKRLMKDQAITWKLM